MSRVPRHGGLWSEWKMSELAISYDDVANAHQRIAGTAHGTLRDR
jgi:hypothetical protein